MAESNLTKLWKSHRICSLHFEANCYLNPNDKSSNLVINAVPTLFETNADLQNSVYKCLKRDVKHIYECVDYNPNVQTKKCKMSATEAIPKSLTSDINSCNISDSSYTVIEACETPIKFNSHREKFESTPAHTSRFTSNKGKEIGN